VKNIVDALLAVDYLDYNAVEMALEAVTQLASRSPNGKALNERVRHGSRLLYEISEALDGYTSTIDDMLMDIEDSETERGAQGAIDRSRLPDVVVRRAVLDDLLAGSQRSEKITELIAAKVRPLAGLDDNVPLAKIGPGGEYARSVRADHDPRMGQDAARNAAATERRSPSVIPAQDG